MTVTSTSEAPSTVRQCTFGGAVVDVVELLGGATTAVVVVVGGSVVVVVSTVPLVVDDSPATRRVRFESAVRLPAMAMPVAI
ncbi:MAG: hypothetical protein JO148_12935, partial [Acidimicrobiia bacterium]|nr:hypothetical protein [Acidimicrobiia bacterium]